MSDDAGERVGLACVFALLVVPCLILQGYFRSNQLYVLELEYTVNEGMVRRVFGGFDIGRIWVMSYFSTTIVQKM